MSTVPAKTRGPFKSDHSHKINAEAAKATKAFEFVRGAMIDNGTFNVEIA